VTTTLAQAQRMGATRAIALCHCFSGALEFQSGHWSTAEEALRQSIQLYREIGAASGEALACQRLGVVQTARGQLAEGLATLYEGLAAAERALMRAHCLTRIYATIVRNRLADADLPAADNALTLGLAMSERHGNCATCDALLLPVAISVRIAQGDFAGAETFCRQLDKAAEKYASHLWVAMARQSHGELAAAQGQLGEALKYYAEALAGFRSAGNDYEAARCLTALASIRLTRNAAGDKEAAHVVRSEAQHIFERLAVV
jgi:predicted negative regulator of RcsB-dependent stress response